MRLFGNTEKPWRSVLAEKPSLAGKDFSPCPWERTHPACPVSDTQSTLEAGSVTDDKWQMANEQWQIEVRGPDNELPLVIFHWSLVICHFFFCALAVSF